MPISIQQVDVYVPIYKKRALSDSFFIFVLRREGCEGTDLAARAHLERPYSATGIQCNPK